MRHLEGCKEVDSVAGKDIISTAQQRDIKREKAKLEEANNLMELFNDNGCFPTSPGVYKNICTSMARKLFHTHSSGSGRPGTK